MASTTASRFSMLKMDEDIDKSKKKKPKQQNKQVKQQQPAPKKKPNINVKKNDSKSAAQELQSQLKSMAFGATKKKKNKPQKMNGVIDGGSKQTLAEEWEEWKDRDTDFVEENFEEELKKAILQSKLDVEENKVVETTENNDTEESPVKIKKSGKKKEREKTLSLGEFNNLLPSQVEKLADGSPPAETPPARRSVDIADTDTQFFSNIEKDVRKAITREQLINSYKGEEGRQAFLQEKALSLQIQEEMDSKDKEIEDLKEELVTTKAELQKVKQRNKKMCQIFGQSEVRDKVEILVQVEKLTSVRDELTENVTELTAQLEQERTKVSQLQTQLKQNTRKRNDTDH